MKLSQYNGGFPFGWNRVMDSFFDDDSFFSSPNRLNVPATNIQEEDNSYQISMAVPGLEKDDFKIEIDKGILTVSSEKRVSSETQEDNFTRKEYSYNSFKRSFALPQNIKEDNIDADYINGELVIKVPKSEVSKPEVKTIDIK